MRHPGPWHSLAGFITLFFAAASHATLYDIHSTDDPLVTVEYVDGDSADPEWDNETEIRITSMPMDGNCSLREAVYASNYRMVVDGCEAGTASDTIRLQRDQVYLLTEGALTVGDGEVVKVKSEEVPAPTLADPNATQTEYTVTFEPLSNQLRFEMLLDSFEEVDDQILPVMTSRHGSRLLNIEEHGSVRLLNIDLQDGDATAEADDGHGGLVRAKGLLLIDENVSFRGGRAADGGAIYLDANSELAFQSGGRFENNTATGVGSVIASSNTFDGDIVGYGFYMADNTAGTGAVDAAAIHLDGDPNSTVTLELGNGTITHNAGGGINVVTDNYQSLLVNMTIAFNEGVALTLAETAFDDPADAETTDHILHSVMVGNSGGACAGAGLNGPGNPDAIARLLFTITDDSNCPEPEEQTSGVPVTNNPNEAESDVLLGKDRQACSGTGAAACEVMPAEALGGPYPGFLPNPAPAALSLDPMAPSLFDRGNPQTVATDPCEARDYRGLARGGAGGRCDVGAVEFLRAQAIADEVNLVSGKSVLADVVANDLNDTTIDCSQVAAPDTCMTILVLPKRGTAQVEIDSQGYPRIRYRASSSYHGVDSLRYVVHRDAFFGGADLDQDQSEIVNLVAEPASGLTESKSISDSGGSQGLWMLLLLAAAGLARRYRLSMVAATVLLGSPVWAADITVNSLLDSTDSVTNDGNCTLREALANASAASSPDCAYGSNSGDRILIPAGDIQLQAPLIIKGGAVELEGNGARDEDSSDADDTRTRILGNGSERLFEVQTEDGTLHPSVTFRYLTLEGGVAAGSSEAGSGAVIVTGGSVIFDRTVIRNNHAEGSGGVAYIRANAGEKKLLTFNRSHVAGNSAHCSGGVAATVATQEDFSLALVDSTFENNTADADGIPCGDTAMGDEGGVLDANIGAGKVAISNSTFVDNMAPKGSALDLSGLVIDAYIMNSTFMNNGPGTGLELGNADSDVTLANSIYFDSGPACSSGSTLLYQSYYNAFSATACQTGNAANALENQAGLGSAALESTLSDATGSRADYVPPYLAMANPATDTQLIDKGNADALQTGTIAPLRCRQEDLRGIARTSGGRCDLGAFEYQQITAEDDEGGNQESRDQRLVVDILANDLASDGADIVYLDDVDPGMFKPGVFAFEHAVVVAGSDPVTYQGSGQAYSPDASEDTLYVLDSAGTAYQEYHGASIQFVWRYYNEDKEGQDLLCGDPLPQAVINANPELFEEGAVAEECVVMFTPADTEAFKDSVCQAESSDPVTTAFTYTFTDSEGQTSDPATVVLTLIDTPPVLEGQSVVNKPGNKVVFKLKAEDPDNPDTAFDWSRYQINLKNAPSFSKRDDSGTVLGAGLIIDQDAGTVTYVPDSNYNTFKDTFTLTVEDLNCDNVSQSATFTVRYRQQDASGGSGGGSPGWLIPGLLLGLGLARVFQHQRQTAWRR